MKVVFVQPYYENIWESIGLGYIISYCKANYQGTLEVEFYQGNFDNDEKIIQAGIQSDIIAFSCTSPAWNHALTIAQKVKELNSRVKTVFGGWHITALPKECLNESVVDQVIVGEGEIAMLEILNGAEAPVVLGHKIGFQDLPWPDREAIKNIRTIDLCESMNGKRIASFQSNRVCPVSCSYCAEDIMTGKYNKKTNPIRSRNPIDVCEEIDYVIKKYQLNYFKFVDATFDVSAEHVINFCEEKIKRDIKCQWECLIHASFVQEEEVFKWLEKANCNQINVGVETGSDKIQKDIGKGINWERTKRVFDLAKKYDIERRAFFILGMPNETEEDIKLTEKWIDEVKPDVVGFTILCPYPGSDHYDREKYKDIDWSVADEYSNDFWNSKHYTNRELKSWQSYLKQKYDKLLCERQEYNPDYGMTNFETVHI